MLDIIIHSFANTEVIIKAFQASELILLTMDSC
jgi:hypothetical protein